LQMLTYKKRYPQFSVDIFFVFKKRPMAPNFMFYKSSSSPMSDAYTEFAYSSFISPQ